MSPFERIAIRRVRLLNAANSASMDGRNEVAITLREMAFRVGQREEWWRKARRNVAARIYLATHVKGDDNGQGV